MAGDLSAYIEKSDPCIQAHFKFKAKQQQQNTPACSVEFRTSFNFVPKFI